MKRISKITLIIISVIVFSVILGHGLSYYFPMPLYQYNETVNITCFGCRDITPEDYDPLFILAVLLPTVCLVAIIVRLIPDKKIDELDSPTVI